MKSRAFVQNWQTNGEPSLFTVHLTKRQRNAFVLRRSKRQYETGHDVAVPDGDPIQVKLTPVLRDAISKAMLARRFNVVWGKSTYFNAARDLTASDISLPAENSDPVKKLPAFIPVPDAEYDSGEGPQITSDGHTLYCPRGPGQKTKQRPISPHLISSEPQKNSAPTSGPGL